MKKKSNAVLVPLLFLFLLGCPPKNKNNDEVKVLTQKGQVLFNTTCTVCHNSNPKLDGPIGPAISGSSFELLQLKIRKGEYPTGHKPKRETKIMTLMPQLSDDDIKAIHTYLQSF
ncbi:MAG TPA: cytochrome c [Bdellovibrionota bacterium]|nr:cytochrome c [Bdellovibrionota bacterium]